MKALRNILSFLLAVALMAGVLGYLAPEPHLNIVSAKLEWMREHGDEFDVLFLGSSRTYHQILPERFEEILGAAGQKVKAFNLGVDGMRPPEDGYVLEQALRGRSKPLRWVFVECSPLRFEERPEDRGTLRAAYWHDWKRTVTMFRRAFLADEKDRKFRDRLKEIGGAWPTFQVHLEYFFENYLQVGRGSTAWERHAFKGHYPKIQMWDLGDRQDGYRPSDTRENMTPPELEVYAQQVAKLRAKPPRVDYADRISQEELRNKQRVIEKAGGKMILIQPPYMTSRIFHPRLGGENPPLVFDLTSLEKYPALYAPENKSDSGHLNRAGAELYTREIARLLLDHLD